MAAGPASFQDSLDRARAAQSRDGEVFNACLVCGFTPLALRVQLAAAVAECLPSRRIECATSSVDEFLEGRASAVHGVAVVCEWSDLDPRLGVRRAGGWGGDAAADAVATAETRLALLAECVASAAQQSRIALALPALELPPVFTTPRPAADPLALRCARRWPQAPRAARRCRESRCSNATLSNWNRRSVHAAMSRASLPTTSPTRPSIRRSWPRRSRACWRPRSRSRA
jgi:hypothetical protein